MSPHRGRSRPPASSASEAPCGNRRTSNIRFSAESTSGCMGLELGCGQAWPLLASRDSRSRGFRAGECDVCSCNGRRYADPTFVLRLPDGDRVALAEPRQGGGDLVPVRNEVSDQTNNVVQAGRIDNVYISLSGSSVDAVQVRGGASTAGTQHFSTGCRSTSWSGSPGPVRPPWCARSPGNGVSARPN
jgi:hypothetical protein